MNKDSRDSCGPKGGVEGRHPYLCEVANLIAGSLTVWLRQICGSRASTTAGSLLELNHWDEVIGRSRPFVALDMLILPKHADHGLPCFRLPEICHESHVTSSWQSGLVAWVITCAMARPLPLLKQIMTYMIANLQCKVEVILIEGSLACKSCPRKAISCEFDAVTAD